MTLDAPAVSAPTAAPDPSEADLRYAAVTSRDTASDGRFLYGVVSTGVVCHPSCGARTPRRSQVRYFTNLDEALASGFRPCKRCRPDLAPARVRQARSVARACRELEATDARPDYASLAARSGLGRSRFHELFREVTGTTPAAYWREVRARRLGPDLRDATRCAAALPDFGAASTVHAVAGARLGMTPGTYRSGGAHVRLRLAVAPCALGYLLVGATDRGVARVALGDDPEALRASVADDLPRADLVPGSADAVAWLAELVAYLEAPSLPSPDLPLDVRGTAFQCLVWDALREVRSGETLSYRELAGRIGRPAASRAVARACATNPVALLVPCHRVLGQDGALRGYRWGLARKRALLIRESSGGETAPGQPSG